MQRQTPPFSKRLEYEEEEALQQDHPVWSLISETLEDSLHGGKQQAVMLLQICKRAEEGRQHIEKDLFNAQQFYERELKLYEASITSL